MAPRFKIGISLQLPQKRAGTPALVASGILGAEIGMTTGALGGLVMAGGLCAANYSDKCFLASMIGGAWLGDVYGVAYAIHRANNRQGNWSRVVKASFLSSPGTLFIQIPTIISAERRPFIAPADTTA